MDIKNLRPDPTPPRPTAPVIPVREDARRAPAPEADRGETRDDRVEFSQEARSRAAGLAGEDTLPGGLLPPSRLMELRRRILERAHDSPIMADAVMRQIVERGDL
jgi:hypothetical protein